MSKNDSYTYAQTCVYKIQYHIVWCVKYRRKALTADVGARLKELLAQIGTDKGFIVITSEVGGMDHVHCFVSSPATLSPCQTVKYLKGISGRRILMEFPAVKDK